MMTNPTGRITQGQFSFLPELSDAEIALQITYGLAKGYPGASSTPTIRIPATRTGKCSACRCST
jgi:ribulose bisphosphate carboxylase small subunit